MLYPHFAVGAYHEKHTKQSHGVVIMVRQHPDTPADIACIWPATPNLLDEIAQRLTCWAKASNNANLIVFATTPSQHFHVPKNLCTLSGALHFTDSDADQCPLGDDLTVSVATSVNPTTCTNTQAENDTTTWNLPDAVTPAIIINRSATVDPNTSSDTVDINYKGVRASWHNEWGGPRTRVPTQAALGYADVAQKLFEQAEGNGDGLQIFGPSDGATPKIRTRNGELFVRRLTASDERTAWVPIVVDSPTTASKFTNHTDGVSNYNSLQAQVYDYGRMARWKGRVDVVVTGGATDEVFISTLPTAIPIGTSGATVSAVPPRVRGFMAMGSGGGLRIEVLINGNVRVLGSALTQPYIEFEWAYSLEA